MKHLFVIVLLLAGASACEAQFRNFGGRAFGGGRGIGSRPMTYRSNYGTGRIGSNVWLDFTTRRGARVMGPYNMRSDRLDLGNMWLVPNSYWGWQGQYRQRDEEEYFDDEPAPRPAVEQTGWRKYLRN